MTTIQINDLITLPLHLKQSSCPNYFFLLADPLFLSSRWQVVEKRGKIILASSRVHSHTASLVSAHRSKAIPDLFWNTFFVMLQTWIFRCFRYEGWTATFATVSFFSRSSILQLYSQWTWWKVWRSWLWLVQSGANEKNAIWSADVLLRLSKQSSNASKRIR